MFKNCNNDELKLTDDSFSDSESGEGETRRALIVTSIEITTPPTKTVYQVGECFDPSGMVVKAHYSNGNSAIITLYEYSPVFGLSLSDTTITITFLDKTAYQPISVIATNCLLITHNPNKMSYQIGDYFEPYGMIIKEYDNNGVGQNIYDYSFSPNGPLTANDTTITFTHGSFTKTLTISINNSPTEGYFPSQYTKNSLIGNNPYLNLFDLSTLFKTKPFSVSRDSYSLSFYLTYFSRMKGRLSTLIKGLPHRFQTNYHQFIIQDGVDDNNNPIYKFIDNDSFIHSFYKINNTLFYCRHSNLFLFFFSPNNDYYAKIVDSNQNELYFNANSQLIKIISGKDSNNIKHIVYNNGFITKVYDERDSTTELLFNYTNALLSSVSFKYRGTIIKSLVFTYSTDSFGSLLTDITETNPNNNSRSIYSFAYNNNMQSHSTYDRVEYVNDFLEQQTYRFAYSYHSSPCDYTINYLKRGCFTNNSFVIKEEMNCISSTQRSDTFKTFSEVTIKNENDKYFDYYLDKAARIASCFECGGIFDTTFKTLYKESGKYIDIGGAQYMTINSHGFNNVFNPLTFSIPNNYLSGYKHFVLRMYVKINNCSSKRIRVILTSPYSLASVVSIDEEQFSKIVLVEVPFTKIISLFFPTLSFNLAFKDENDNNVEVDIADLYIDKKARTSLLFYDGTYSFDSLATLKIYNSQYGLPIEYDNMAYPYFTEQDFMNTLFLEYRHYNLWGNGSRILLMSNGKHFTTYGVAFAGADLEDTNFFISIYLSSPSQPWYFKTESPDGKTVTKTHYHFFTDYYEIVNEVTYNNDASTLQTENKRYLYNNTLLQITHSHLDNNQTISSTTTYEYFNNGELKKVSTSSGNETIVIYDSSQDNNGYISRKTNGLTSTDITYQNYLEDTIYRNLVNGGSITHSAYKKVFGYDQYCDDLYSVSFFENSVNVTTNDQTFDYSNNEALLRINNANLYKISNNNNNNTTIFKRYDDNFGFQNVLTICHTNSFYQTIYHINSSNVHTISDNYDSYGKIISQTIDNSNKVTYEYESSIESSYCANLDNVLDKYIDSSGKTTSFIFEQNYGDLSQVVFDNGAFAISFDNENGIVEYSFNSSVNQGIAVQNLYDKTINSITNYHSLSPISRTFSNKRDGFNRIVKSSYEMQSDFWYLVCCSFVPSSNRINSFSFCSSSGDFTPASTKYSESYGYDQYGNLNAIAINNTANARTYTYDGFGRLIAETNDFVSEYNRSYSYYSDGKMEYFGATHMTYNNYGQLQSFGSISFSYDRYGNRLWKNNDSYIYERGKLLKKVIIDGIETSFKYDYLGRRCQKTSGVFYDYTITKYYYHDNRLIAETRECGADFIKLLFLYNGDEIIGFCKCDQYSEKIYYYVKNPFGLITLIVDEYNTIVALYHYDAWGNHVAINPSDQQEDIANLNPIRYKGYYFDKETNLYYLKARYYDPSVGQFISPDDYSFLDINNISGYDLYAYCKNNPIMFRDKNGHLPEWLGWIISGLTIGAGIALTATGYGGIIGGILIGAGAGSIIGGYSSKVSGGSFTAGYFGGLLSGAICGAGAGLGGYFLTIASNAVNYGVIGYLSASTFVSFFGGFFGNLSGTLVASFLDNKLDSFFNDFDIVICDSIILGSLNIVAGISSGLSSTLALTGRLSNDFNTKLVCKILAGTIAGGTESIYDLSSCFVLWLMRRLES